MKQHQATHATSGYTPDTKEQTSQQSTTPPQATPAHIPCYPTPQNHTLTLLHTNTQHATTMSNTEFCVRGRSGVNGRSCGADGGHAEGGNGDVSIYSRGAVKPSDTERIPRRTEGICLPGEIQENGMSWGCSVCVVACVCWTLSGHLLGKVKANTRGKE